MDFKNKNVVITGATGGIGREIVKELDEVGFRLILLGKHEDELKNLCQTLQNRNSVYYVCDFSNLDNVIKIGSKISKNFKIIDVLLNVAGIGIYKAIEEVNVKDWNDSFNIGNTSPFFLTKALLPNLNKSDISVVINFGSGMGILPAAGRSVYCSMKFALRGQTLSLAEEFKGMKPNFVLMSLGSVLTSFGPMSIEEKRKDMESGKNYLTPEWVSKKVIEIIKDKNRKVEYTLYPSNYSEEWQR